MESVERLVLTFLINTVWQIPALLVVATLGARLLRRGPARYRHALWIGALAASVLLPAASLLPRRTAPRTDIRGPVAVFSGRDQAPEGWPAWMPTDSKPAQLPDGLARAAIVVYGLSLGIHALRLARAWRWTVRLARSARDAALLDIPEPAAVIAARCREAFGLGRVPLLCSAAVDGPVTLGAREPAILLPPAFLEQAPSDHLIAALGHEMSHIRRRDFLLNLLGELWLLPVSFHPALGWLRRRLAETREMACDEATVERLIAPRAYARSLLAMASTFAGSSRPAYTLGALDADLLEVRMRRLLDSEPRLGARRARATLTVAALLLAAATLTAAGFSLGARTAGAATGDLHLFLGTWKGEYSPEPGLTLPANELIIRDLGGGKPEVTLVWFLHHLKEDGTVKTDRVSPQVLDARITGRVLRFRTQSQMQYRPDLPKEQVEFDQVFELFGNDDNQGTLRQIWSSLEGRHDVPPPPPPTILKRQG